MHWRRVRPGGKAGICDGREGVPEDIVGPPGLTGRMTHAKKRGWLTGMVRRDDVEGESNGTGLEAPADGLLLQGVCVSGPSPSTDPAMKQG